MITINNNITEESCWLYDSEGNFVGEIKNELALYDVRIQIKRQQLEGYKILCRGNYYDINKYGQVRDYPDDLFPMAWKSLDELTEGFEYNEHKKF